MPSLVSLPHLGFRPMTSLLPRMALHDWFDIVTLYAGHFFRFLAVAVILLGVFVLVGRLIGMEPHQLRLLIAPLLLSGLGVSAVLATITAWMARRRRVRRKRY